MPSEKEEEDSAGQDIEPDDRIPQSKVLDLFKTKKNDAMDSAGGAIKSTAASNFRNSFASSRGGVMALFFSPGQDYQEKPYANLELFRYPNRSEKRPEVSYFNSALKTRLALLSRGDQADAMDVLSILLPKNEEPGKNEVEKEELHTFFTVFWEQFGKDSRLEEGHRQKVRLAYQSFNIHEKEAFSKFIRKGALMASSAVVDFFRLFRQIPPGEGAEQYRKFIQKVRENLCSMRLYHQVQESILLFKTLYRKEFAITSPENLVKEDWDYFDNAQPVYPYSRGNSNQKILKSFNTPFFPDVLIATSVLQEGVNLQYFCDSVYHYGMAWTPGDNEQRIGRVDRMFGKTDRRLQAGEKARLEITYPYLKASIDEEQLRRFVKRKFKEENLIDNGFSAEESERTLTDDQDNSDWRQYLRKPTDAVIQDPYPAEHGEFATITSNLPLPEAKGLPAETLLASVADAITGLKELRPRSYSIHIDGYHKLLVDPEMENGRRQPVVIDMLFDPIGSGANNKGKAVYCLRMRTPICPVTEMGELEKAFGNKSVQEAYGYGLKLSMDSGLTGGSYWGCKLAVELPLFISDPEKNHLNQFEITTAFRRLVYCADLIEQEAFGRDLTREELKIPAINPVEKAKEPFRSHSRSRKSCWTSDGEFYFLHKPARKDFEECKEHEKFKKALILNNDHLYVKTVFPIGKSTLNVEKKEASKSGWLHEVSYLRKDAQTDELELMQKHLEVFMKRLEWRKRNQYSKFGTSSSGSA
jgi:hypothetical protein